MKILVVHEVNYLSKIVFEYQILPEILSSLGHDVTIVDYDETWRAQKDTPIFSITTRIHRNVHRAYPNGPVTVRRPGMIRVGGLSRLSGAILNGIEVQRALAESSFDAILLYGLPTVGVQTLLAARRNNVPVFFRSIDVMHKLAPNKLLSFITQCLEGVIFPQVDGIIAATNHLADLVKSYGVRDVNVRVLPNGVDTVMFSPGERNNSLLATWGVGPADPVFLFMGTIYRFSGLDRVIADFPRLLKQHPKAKLMIVGWGEDELRLTQLARDTGVANNVIFTGLQSYALLPDIVRSADVCINPFELNGITRDIIANKLFQYLACGRPLLATPLPGTLPFLSGEHHGVVYSSLESFVDDLTTLFNDPERRRILGENGAAYTRDNFDWKAIAAKMVEYMQELACV